MHIIITSNESWGDIWYSKQNYAHELSKLGHTVYFINSPRLWKFKNLFSFSAQCRRVEPNLYVLDYYNNFPIRIIPYVFRYLNDLINSWKLYKKIGPEEVIFWQFDPYRFSNVFFFSIKVRIYHVVDPYQHISTDLDIAKKSNLIVLVDTYYEKRYNALDVETLIIPHGISQEDIEVDVDIVDNVIHDYGNYILFTGTVNDDVDLDLLRLLVERLTLPLVIIGPVFLSGDMDKVKFDTLIGLPTVKYLGSLHYKKLKNYINASMVCITPYKKTLIQNIHRTPLKIVQYLAHGKAVVSTKPANFKYKNIKRFYYKDDTEEFLNSVRKLVLEGVRIDLSQQKEFLEKNDYQKHISTIFKKCGMVNR
ncbi:glycosyltransferase family 1 protein [Fulvivirga sp. M361]|uniref:glycosyltransferase n=1 Tax=Fulvivirga sp. M361 TaxID=2594266 RepID=UPI00117A2C3E|nr:glycosyltransferase [Fulvivirga sp. M361]TRX55607.1 glycosyltransferase family 1 protein [Fulvivirga sp. M361]